MRSFSLLALAAAALAPFVGAAPSPVGVVAGAKVGAGVEVRDIHAVAGVGAAAAVHVREPALPGLPVPPVNVADVSKGIQVRGGQRGVAAILVDLKVKLAVHVDALNFLTKDNATTEVITPCLKEIVGIFGDAVVELKALVGADISVILCAVDGTAQLAVGVVAQLLAEVLCLVFGALGFVLSIVADVQIIIQALVAVAFGDCICEFLNAVLCLIDGLLAALIPLVSGLLGTILALGLSVVATVLTLV